MWSLLHIGVELFENLGLHDLLDAMTLLELLGSSVFLWHVLVRAIRLPDLLEDISDVVRGS